MLVSKSAPVRGCGVREVGPQVDDLVVVMDEGLRGEACAVATRLRAAGRCVDLVLESKKMKWVFKQSERSVPPPPSPFPPPRLFSRSVCNYIIPT